MLTTLLSISLAFLASGVVGTMFVLTLNYLNWKQL